jgi:hypothetical protein
MAQLLDDNKKSQYMNLVPGFVQGIVRVGISYPFDSVKTYMQKGIYKSTLSAFKGIIGTDIRILYRGSSLVFTIVPIDRSIQYFFAEKLNKKYNPFMTGIIMGIGSSIYSVPLQFITTNAILTSKNNYVGIIDFVRKMDYKKFYRGYTLELPRSILGTAGYLGTYMFLRDNVDPKYKLYISPFLGSFASITSWMLIFPLDTVRTERQTTMDKTIWNIIKDKYHIKGIRGFYLGITPVIARSIPSASCGMLAYEYTKKLLALD